MVWWKIKDPNGARGADATRGLDTPENLYNGDEVVELVTAAVERILAHTLFNDDKDLLPPRDEPIRRVTYDQMRDLLLNKQLSGLLQNGDATYLNAVVEGVWLDVNDLYIADWGRSTRPEERQAIVNFVIKGRFDERPKERSSSIDGET
jgi:hypothetical protein